MDYFTKNKMLFWFIIILVVINIVTLVSFWMIKSPLKHPLASGKSPEGKKIMEERLQLSEEQVRQFEQIRNEHFSRTDTLQRDIHKIRMDLLEELFSPDADKPKMQAMLTELGNKQLKFETNLYKHFAELKQACNDQQTDELNLMLRDLIESTRTSRPVHHRPDRHEGFKPGHRPPLLPR